MLPALWVWVVWWWAGADDRRRRQAQREQPAAQPHRQWGGTHDGDYVGSPSWNIRETTRTPRGLAAGDADAAMPQQQ